MLSREKILIDGRDNKKKGYPSEREHLQVKELAAERGDL